MIKVSKSAIETLKFLKLPVLSSLSRNEVFFLQEVPILSPCSYTMFVAVNSMVGHILGLVDRHTNNIPTRRQRVPSHMVAEQVFWSKMGPRDKLNGFYLI